MSYDLAARRLEVTTGTIRGRLAKARRLLRARLARKGEIPTVRSAPRRSVGLEHSRRAVPCSLVAAITRAAIKVAAGRVEAHGVSMGVTRLMEGVLSMTFLSRMKMAAMVLAACGIAIAAAAALASKSAGTEIQGAAGSSEPLAARKASVSLAAAGARSGVESDASNRKGMTLEEAVDRFLSRYVSQWRPAEIPMARADALVHFDTTAATSLNEAVFQDAVRNQIDHVYKSFVNLEVAQEKLRRASDTLARWVRIRDATLSQIADGTKPSDDIRPIASARAAAKARQNKATDALREARLSLGMLLEIPANECRTLEVASRLSRLRSAVLPPLNELVRSALGGRPDLAALRFGEKRSEADLAEARTNPFARAYILYQPYTFGVVLDGRVKDNSWARGVSVPLPLFSRVQGNLQRKRINVEQTRAQLASMERRISDDLEQIYLDCELSLAERARMERGILADAAKRRDAAEQAYLAEPAPGAPEGRPSLTELMRSSDEYQKEDRRFVVILARCLGSTLDLNTAVAKPILP